MNVECRLRSVDPKELFATKAHQPLSLGAKMFI
jgi:hypothetical protein